MDVKFKEMIQSVPRANAWVEEVSEAMNHFLEAVHLQPADEWHLNEIQLQTGINLPGVYALISGLDYVGEQKNHTPAEVLQEIIQDNIPEKERLLFCRLANCTWKVTQPYRGIERITRPNFIPFSLLEKTEQQKDMVQIKAAAKEFISLLPLNGQLPAATQWKVIKEEMREEQFMQTVAQSLFEAYYLDIGEEPPRFAPQEHSGLQEIKTTVKPLTGLSLAVLYVLECFCNALSPESGAVCSDILSRIQKQTLTAEERQLLNAFFIAGVNSSLRFTGKAPDAFVLQSRDLEQLPAWNMACDRLLAFAAGQLQTGLSA